MFMFSQSDQIGIDQSELYRCTIYDSMYTAEERVQYSECEFFQTAMGTDHSTPQYGTCALATHTVYWNELHRFRQQNHGSLF